MKTFRTVPRARAPRSNSGFTLIELAVVVFVVALLLGSILVPLSTQVEQRQIADTQRQLEEIREALIGFAVANGALPCPDKTTGGGAGTANDGEEDVAGTCATEEGNLPWVTLGLGAADAWNSRFRYRVTRDFAQRTPPTFALDTPGDIRVCGVADCSAEPLTVATGSLNSPVAVVLSHGPNRWGAQSVDTAGPVLPPGCAAVVGCGDVSDLEEANADPAHTLGTPPLRVFVSRPSSPAGSSVGEFDDLVVWLSPHTLKNRMVAAGKLP